MPDSRDTTAPILYVAIGTPAGDGFDYLPPRGAPLPEPGCRLRVPFGRGESIGVLVEVRAKSDVPPARLKHALAVLDEQPVVPPPLMELARWASGYYHHPLGEVVHAMLPATLRRGLAAAPRGERRWRIAGNNETAAPPARAPKQAAVFETLREAGGGLTGADLDRRFARWRETVRALEARGLIESVEDAPVPEPRPARPRTPQGVELNAEQRAALERIAATPDGFAPWLVQGVTGSGKTELYLRLIEQALARDEQVLVLVPEIGLTPQLLERFAARLDRPVWSLHSGLADARRHGVWYAAWRGETGVFVGTRSAVFLPLARPGLIVVDEEHDGSFKQQEGFRYHARDLAVMRARRHNVPVILGSATPSLESLHNALQGRYGHLQLTRRAGGAVMPKTGLLDARHSPADQPVSRPLLEAMDRHLEQGSQVLIFLNRRGFAPVLYCAGCGWTAGCRRCDAHLTLHSSDRRLRCHHCGVEQRVPAQCPECGEGALKPVGAGTEQLEDFLRERFPSRALLRIDRDTVRRKGSLEARLEQARSGRADILIGTQMLAKGHHFPGVTLVGLLGVDQGLFSADFRGPEFMAQLVTQVGGRAGRAERGGEVLIETRCPDHALLRLLIGGDYARFARASLAERRAAGLPPYTYLALIRAEAVTAETALEFLAALHGGPEGEDGKGPVEILGPVPAPMERRAGRYRAQLLLQCAERPALHAALHRLRRQAAALPGRRKVRWSIDVDPVEML